VTTYAEPDDLVTRFPRELTDDEETRAETLLEDASFWLGVWVPGLDGAITGGNEQVAQAAKLLVVAMVRRNLLIPAMDDGVSSSTQIVGPFQNVVAYRNPDGNLYLYSKELDAIRGLMRSNQSDAISVTAPGL
jgi:hypothetical protein